MSRGPIRNGGQFAWQLGRSMDAVRTPRPEWLDEQALHFEVTRQEYLACHPRWLRVPGGRAAHALMEGAQVPLCGVVPRRTDGTVSPWRAVGPGSVLRLHHHRRCQRLAAQVTAQRLSELFWRQREEIERDRL